MKGTAHVRFMTLCRIIQSKRVTPGFIARSFLYMLDIGRTRNSTRGDGQRHEGDQAADIDQSRDGDMFHGSYYSPYE